MKKLSIIFLAVLISGVFVSGALAKGALRKTWTDAKKQAEAALKKEKLGSLSKNVKFKEDFGPTLDNYEAAKKKTLKEALKDKTWSGHFYDFLKKEYSQENYEFYTLSPKMKPLDIYNTYIKQDAAKQVNLPAASFNSWKAVFEDNAKYNKKILATSRDEIFSLMLSDSFPRFLSDNPVRTELIQKLKTIIASYEKKIDAMAKPKQQAAKDILLTALNEIAAKVK